MNISCAEYSLPQSGRTRQSGSENGEQLSGDAGRHRRRENRSQSPETGHSLGAWQTSRAHDRHQTARHQHAGTDGQIGGLSARLTEEFACGRQSLHGYFPPEPLYRKLYRQREKVSFEGGIFVVIVLFLFWPMCALR